MALFQFDNRFSWVDILALGGAAVSVLYTVATLEAVVEGLEKQRSEDRLAAQALRVEDRLAVERLVDAERQMRASEVARLEGGISRDVAAAHARSDALERQFLSEVRGVAARLDDLLEGLRRLEDRTLPRENR